MLDILNISNCINSYFFRMWRTKEKKEKEKRGDKRYNVER